MLYFFSIYFSLIVKQAIFAQAPISSWNQYVLSKEGKVSEGNNRILTTDCHYC